MRSQVLFILFSLILCAASNSLNEYYSNEENDTFASSELKDAAKKPCSGTTFIYTSSTGMGFTTNKNSDGTVGVVYNCEVGVDDSGIIKTHDETHPPSFSNLEIVNCKSITLFLSDTKHLNSIKVKNVETLLVKKREEERTRQFNYKSYGNKYEEFKFSVNEISIENVKFLQVESNFQKFINIDDSISIIKVGMNDLEIMSLIKNTFLSKIILNGITVSTKGSDSEYRLCSNGKPDSFVIIENSTFLQEGKIIGESHMIKMSNNTFASEFSFDITANQSFIFSNNFIKKLKAMNVTSPNVEIVENKFHYIQKEFLNYVTIDGEDEIMRKLIVSNNTFNILPNDFLNVYSPQWRTDEILFENNLLNCSCKNWVALERLSQKEDRDPILVRTIFLHESSKNICLNFPNCTLSHVTSHIPDICSQRFSCEAIESEGHS